MWRVLRSRECLLSITAAVGISWSKAVVCDMYKTALLLGWCRPTGPWLVSLPGGWAAAT